MRLLLLKRLLVIYQADSVSNVSKMFYFVDCQEKLEQRYKKEAEDKAAIERAMHEVEVRRKAEEEVDFVCYHT